MKDISNFVDLMELLISYKSIFGEVLETKALTLVKHSISRHFNVPLKSIYPMDLFLSKENITMKDYYHVAFSMVKNNF